MMVQCPVFDFSRLKPGDAIEVYTDTEALALLYALQKDGYAWGLSYNGYTPALTSFQFEDYEKMHVIYINARKHVSSGSRVFPREYRWYENLYQLSDLVVENCPDSWIHDT